jgi:hypothetical protein
MAFNSTTVTAECFAVTKSDTTKITAYGFYVGTTGDVAIQDGSGNTVTFTAVPAGAVVPVVCSRIMSTGTTASNIVAFGPR